MNFKKITASSLLLAGIAMSPHALAAQSFDGNTINVAFEEWDSVDAVEFAAKEPVDQATIDELYSWAELKYPEYFPTHQDSMYINGYYVRFYPETGVFIGSLKGHLYVYGTQFDGLLDLGELGYWVEEMKAE